MTARLKPSEFSNAPSDHPAACFDAAMAGFGPFEQVPHLAAAVSGGADSMALALLAHDWVNARGGRVTALIVDHGLRAGSDAEARTVADRLRDLGLPAEILTWAGAKPVTGIQAAARAARYGLLRDWCRGAGVLHLLAGHQADDQAETRTMRRARAVGGSFEGAGLGTAGMSAVLEFPDVRLLRPLMATRREDLRSFLAGRGVVWVDDPSNLDPRFERVRLRRDGARDLARRQENQENEAAVERIDTESRVNAALARTVSLSPWGGATLDLERFRGLETPLRHHVLARLVASVGGADHPPPSERTARLVERLENGSAFSGASLGRCRVGAAKQGLLPVCRAARDLPVPVPAQPGERVDWDGRFRVRIVDDLPAEIHLAPLGADGWRQIPRDRRRASGLGLAVARTLPALFSGQGLVGYDLPGAGENGAGGLKIRFRPKNTLGFNGFCIA